MSALVLREFGGARCLPAGVCARWSRVSDWLRLGCELWTPGWLRPIWYVFGGAQHSDAPTISLAACPRAGEPEAPVD